MKSNIKQKLFLLITALFIYSNSFSFMFWNQASHFAGSGSNYIAAAHSTSLNITGSFTFELWIFPHISTSGTRTILEKKLNGNGYSLYLKNGKVEVATDTSVRITGNTVLNIGQWSHIAATYNSISNVFRIFINGNLDKVDTIFQAAPSLNTDSLRIGKGSFIGNMDEIRIWKRVLSGIEISKFRRTSLGANTGVYHSLVLSYTFQNKNADTSYYSLNDWSSNNNIGVNHNVGVVDLSSQPSYTVSPNEGIQLDGMEGYLAARGDSSDINPSSAVTLEAWVYPNSVAGNSTIILKGPPVGGALANYGLSINGGVIHATIDGDATYNSVNAIVPLRWSHIAFTYQGSTGKYAFYINGNESNNGTISHGNITVDPDSLYIGGTSSGNMFNGFIDEVRISGYVKTRLLITDYLFRSIDKSNEPNSGSTNVVYNLDGYSFDNSEGGPPLIFRGTASFSHPATIDNQSVSPLNRQDDLVSLISNNLFNSIEKKLILPNSSLLGSTAFFSDAFYLSNPNRRIPFMDNTTVDSLPLYLDTTITGLSVFVALNHTNEEELRITLIGPNDTLTVVLFDGDSLVSRSDNIITIFDDDASFLLSSSDELVSFAPSIQPLNPINVVFNGINAAGIWKLKIEDDAGGGTGRLYAWGISLDNMEYRIPALKLVSFLQGRYFPTNQIIPDTLRAYLRQSQSPYPNVGVKTKTPDNDGISFFSFPDAVVSDSFYLTFQNRNSIHTWSAVPLRFDYLNYSLAYNFTIDSSNAYGNNQIHVPDIVRKYAIYVGDVNQDSAVDVTDLGLIDNAVFDFRTGYVMEDLTGNDFVDLSDMAIADDNAFNFIVVQHPPP